MAQTLKQLKEAFQTKDNTEFEKLQRYHEGVQECGSETFRCPNCGRVLKKVNAQRQGEYVHLCPKCDKDKLVEW